MTHQRCEWCAPPHSLNKQSKSNSTCWNQPKNCYGSELQWGHFTWEKIRIRKSQN